MFSFVPMDSLKCEKHFIFKGSKRSTLYLKVNVHPLWQQVSESRYVTCVSTAQKPQPQELHTPFWVAPLPRCRLSFSTSLRSCWSGLIPLHLCISNSSLSSNRVSIFWFTHTASPIGSLVKFTFWRLWFFVSSFYQTLIEIPDLFPTKCTFEFTARLLFCSGTEKVFIIGWSKAKGCHVEWL